MSQSFDLECCYDIKHIHDLYLKKAVYMAQSYYLSNAYWKCVGPSLDFVHEERTSCGSCTLIGMVSRSGSFVAPYGDFDINNSQALDMRKARFRFSLVRPDKRWFAFQTDFDASIFAIQSIVNNFRNIKTSSPFLTFDSDGPSVNFAHQVFKYVERPTLLPHQTADDLGFAGEYLAIALSFSPQSEPRRLPVYHECLTHPGHAHIIKATDIPATMMATSLVSINFNLTYNTADGLVARISDIFVIKG